MSVKRSWSISPEGCITSHTQQFNVLSGTFEVTHVIFSLIVQSIFNVRHSKALNSSFKQFVCACVCVCVWTVLSELWDNDSKKHRRTMLVSRLGRNTLKPTKPFVF